MSCFISEMIQDITIQDKALLTMGLICDGVISSDP